MGAIQQLLDVVFPRWCAGCGAWDEHLCADCAAVIGTEFQRVDSGAPYLREVDFEGGEDLSAFPVYALAPYSGSTSRAIVRWKNNVDAGLDQAMLNVWGAAVSELDFWTAFPAAGEAIAAIPVPSAGRRKHEGRFVAGSLAAEVVARAGVRRMQLRDTLKVRRALPLPRQAPQRNLWRRAQKARAAYATGDCGGLDAILVDDVLTSGATLSGAARAVSDSGGRVIGALVIAHTENPR